MLGTTVAVAALPRGVTTSACQATPAPSALSPIEHVFFLVKENHAFSDYFATFPGVTGNPPDAVVPYANGSSPEVGQFPLTGSSTPDLPHDRAASVADLDGGRNDLFVAEAAARGVAEPNDSMGYYSEAQIAPYFAYARNYSLADHFFSGVLGPTVPNRIFDVAATSGGWTSDATPPASAMGFPTILDQLNAAGLPWDYYYTGTESSLTPTLFPSLWNDPCRPAQVLPLSQLPSALAGSRAPAVAFIDPSHDPIYSEHPSENVTLGADWSAAVINTIFASPIGRSSVVFLFFDESGGYFDPVPPPALDPLGDGFRVPLMVLSPWTPSGLLVHDTLDPAALLRFVDENWGLPFLNARVADAASIQPFFRFDQPARAPVLLTTPVSFAEATANASQPSVGTAQAPGRASPVDARGGSFPSGAAAWGTSGTIWGTELVAATWCVASSPSTERSRCSSNPRVRSSRSR